MRARSLSMKFWRVGLACKGPTAEDPEPQITRVGYKNSGDAEPPGQNPKAIATHHYVTVGPEADLTQA
jgi:hypothetical protein